MFTGPGRQGLSQPQPGAGQPAGSGGSPDPGHRAPPLGQGQASLGQEDGPQVGSAWQGLWPGRAGLWGAGDWQRGLKWVLGRGQGGGGPRGLGRDREVRGCPQP